MFRSYIKKPATCLVICLVFIGLVFLLTGLLSWRDNDTPKIITWVLIVLGSIQIIGSVVVILKPKLVSTDPKKISIKLSFILMYMVSMAIGSVALVLGFKEVSDLQQIFQHAQEAPGKIISLGRGEYRAKNNKCAPQILFKTSSGQEVTFFSGVGQSCSAYSLNQNVTVLYNTTNPEQARIKNWKELYVPILLVVGASFLFLVPFVILIKKLMRKLKFIRLKQNGQKISAQVVSVKRDTTGSVGGRNPFRIRAQGINPFTHNQQIFESQNIWIDPRPHMKNVKEVAIYLDHKNVHTYYMEVSFLPKIW